MQMFGASKVGAACAIAGAGLLFVGTFLHPMEADPNDALAAFAEYTADRLWVASHLVQLAGVALIAVALLLLAQQLEFRKGLGVTRIAVAGAVISLALAAALQAVDGIALKTMVDAWAKAPALGKESAFRAAFAVRQVEIGFASMFCLSVGITATVFGVALLGDDSYPKWFAVLPIVGGLPTAGAGVVIAYTGFSGLAMAINMVANLILLLWVLVLGWFMWREVERSRGRSEV
ncbi:MAG: hypothetical protein KatS3mg077_2131 [Candidatus Binatia bacterium]|nr:MAG: hypothetical protein KatS3mg015_3083 [Fimbriimonadales bacterium]GIW44849.1 MAG: hypothetical protein KatS3mg077_2131 [Candidatus Binatia bacterium]